MKYEIQSKSDFLTGLSLSVKVPEDEIDKNALYTIQADCPEFILPFHYKKAGGYIELVYKVGTLCKLQYFSGNLTQKEYTGLWQSLLEPLLICTDWFMNPSSFVLNTDYLYYDKNRKTVNYIYIPSVECISGYDAFYEMAVGVSKLMTVSDAVLENKVLRAIMKDFNPLEFLQMLRKHGSECDGRAVNMSGPFIRNEPDEKNEKISAEKYAEKNRNDLTEPQADEPFLSFDDSGEDIPVNLLSELRKEQHKREKETGGYRFFGSKGKKKKTTQEPDQEKCTHIVNNGMKNVETPEIVTAGKQAEIIDETQNTSILHGETGLRYIGNMKLPPVIQVQIKEGEVYSIGRFDANVGKKQSSFEFDKKTKAVSRRHAVVERGACGYSIIDLASSAGTFVNDKKLPPNTPFELESGFRVSFGNSGADYVWEVS